MGARRAMRLYCFACSREVVSSWMGGKWERRTTAGLESRPLGHQLRLLTPEQEGDSILLQPNAAPSENPHERDFFHCAVHYTAETRLTRGACSYPESDRGAVRARLSVLLGCCCDLTLASVSQQCHEVGSSVAMPTKALDPRWGLVDVGERKMGETTSSYARAERV